MLLTIRDNFEPENKLSWQGSTAGISRNRVTGHSTQSFRATCGSRERGGKGEEQSYSGSRNAFPAAGVRGGAARRNAPVCSMSGMHLDQNVALKK